MTDNEVSEGDRLPGAPHPREHIHLVGHNEAEASVLSAWRARRLPHAFLIGGPPGIGKATLAYRIARFLLTAGAADGADAPSLAVAPDHPIARRVGSLAHPDLLVLRRASQPDRKLPSEISVDEIRRTVGFFGQTAAAGGWRICIVDSVEELNRAGINALLKVLEEPPPRSLLLLISNAPGRVLPTIRSRCQLLRLRPLSSAAVAEAIGQLAPLLPDLPQDRIADAAAASDGSVGGALALLLGEGLEVRKLSGELLDALPVVDAEKLHLLGDRIQSEQGLAVFAEAVESWLAERATSVDHPVARLARFADAWDKVRRAAIDADIFGLNRKPLVFEVFAMLAEASRR